MTNQASREYGHRARIGLLVPSPNTVAETEFWSMAPSGVSIHTSRMPIRFELGMEAIPAMEAEVPRVMDDARTADPTIIAYGCTASSAVAKPYDKQNKLQAIAERPTVTAAVAILEALKSLSITNIALVTPYPQILNDKERAFFSANHINVRSDSSVIADESQLQMRNMCRVPSEQLIKAAISLGSDPSVDGVVLSCCDMPTLTAIPAIEARLDKPVLSSTQALFWKTLREAGITDNLDQFGRLLSQP